MAQLSDPDADAFMASFDHPEAAKDNDAAAFLASFDKPAEPKSPSESVKEFVRHEATSAVMYPAALLRHAYDLTLGDRSAEEADQRQQQFMQDHTTPLTDPTAQGLGGIYQGVQNSAANPISWPGKIINKAGDVVGNVTGSPELGATTKDALQVAGMLAPGVMKGKGTPIDAQAALDSAASKQSMGAAAAAPRIASLSPELQQAVKTAAQKTGGAVPPETLARHVEADSLPIKMQLTEGQATQDPQIISQEMNTRGRTPEMVSRLNEQNKQLAENVQSLREEAGPDVFSTNEVEHGDTLIKAYKDKADIADADIDTKYKALRDANGGKFPVDARQLYGNAAAALHQQLLFEHAPKELGQLETLANKGEMSFEQFEALRTNLARTMRSSSNGNEVAAAGAIRQAMEDLPLSGDVAHLKPLADQARVAAKAQFAALKADPAYDAAVSGKVSPDQFVRKFITGPSATRDGVAQMRAMIGDDDVARQTMAVAALDHLKKSAGLNPMGEGNFSQSTFNKALVSLDPKLSSLVDPKTAEHLSTLGNVARYTQNQPRGSYVNNSNTLVGSLAEGAKGLLESGANLTLAPFGLHKAFPVGTLLRETAQKRSAAKATAKSLAPGAGLTRLPEH